MQGGYRASTSCSDPYFRVLMQRELKLCKSLDVGDFRLDGFGQVGLCLLTNFHSNPWGG